MVMSREPMECNIEIKEYSVKSMKEVVYLRVMFSADGRIERELVGSIGFATSGVGAM